MRILNFKVSFLFQGIIFCLMGSFLSSCDSPFLERHKVRCLAYGLKEGSQEMEKCINKLSKKENQERLRQSYDPAQNRSQSHLESAQRQWQKRKLQRKAVTK